MWEILAALVCLVIAIYVWCTWDYNYWEKCGVPYIKPVFPFGSIKDLILLKKNANTVYGRIYWKYPNEPAVGIYNMLSPEFFLRDPEMIKTVCIKEFSSFHDNQILVDADTEPMLALSPFVAKGDQWKVLRTFQSQYQSSGKIKGMSVLMLEVCQDMIKYLKDNENKPLEAKYLCGQYSTDNLASSVYGLKTNSFQDPKAEFREITAKMFKRTWYVNLGIILATFFPKLGTWLKIRIIPKEVVDFFIQVVTDICNYRKSNKVSRPDFLQSLLDENLKSDKPKHTEQDIAAHSMTFFIDGYETTSTTMAFLIKLLALHPKCQKRLRDELNTIEQITYEEAHKLKYLDACVNETLRLYPPAMVLSRMCTKDITLKSGDRSYPITKGMTVVVPVSVLHKDPAYFPDPETFNPDRFYDTQPPVAFLPFGIGPRACIGFRFALTQIKIGIAHLVKNFKIAPRDSDAKLPVIGDDVGTIITPPELWVKFETIKNL